MDQSKTFAVVVGIESYRAGGDWNLDGAGQSAVDIATWLCAAGVEPKHVKLVVSALPQNAVAMKDQGRRLGVDLRSSANSDDILKLFKDEIATVHGAHLVVYWNGHGILDGSHRFLFTSDATYADPRGIRFDELLVFLEDKLVTGLYQQLLLVDSCANFVEGLKGLRQPTPVRFPHPDRRNGVDQFVIYAAATGQMAMQRDSSFTAAALELLNGTAGPQWPPDATALDAHVTARFVRERERSGFAQTPVYYWKRDWQGRIKEFAITGDAQMARLDIHLLDGSASVGTTEGPVVLTLGDMTLLTLLLSSPGLAMTSERLKLALNLSNDGGGEGSLNYRLSRLRTNTRLRAAGMKVTKDRSSGDYRINVDPRRVDALEVLRIAAVPPAERDAGEVDHVLDMWGSGPEPALIAALPSFFEEVLDAYDKLRRERPKRVLIVDDKVGYHLAQLLGECRCTVVTDLRGFEAHEPHLTDFDLALVDVHLTSSYLDHQGLEIVNRIVNSATDVLVLGMTMKPIPGATRGWQRRHDLAELIQKSGDDETADFSQVVAEVRAVLRAGPQGQARLLMEDFMKVVEEAITQLKARGREPDLVLLKRDISTITDLQVDGSSLSQLRASIKEFRSRWNVEFTLG